MKADLPEVSLISEVVSKLIDELSISPVGRLRIRSQLEARLKKAGLSALRCAELSEASVDYALERIEATFESWDREGVPRPFNYGKSNTIILGLEDGGYSGNLPGEFFDVLNLVQNATDHSLLGISALLCARLECDRIFICDKGGGDAGVDVLARRRGEFCVGHTILAVQAKAHPAPLSRLQVEQISHRFRLGLEEENWKAYKRAAAVEDLPQSPGLVFVVIASKGLSTGGVDAAVLRGLMSSSPRQVAYALARQWSAVQIQAFCASVPSTRNLERNLFHELPQPDVVLK